MAGVRYVGAGVLASSVGMDKHYMKVVFQAHGLPVLPYAVDHRRVAGSATRRRATETVDALGYPVFVKPCRGGSSIGISKVHDRAELDAAVEEARRHDPKVIVEAVGRGRPRGRVRRARAASATTPPEASVVAEIVVDGEPRVLRLRGEVPPGGAHRADRPRRPPRRRRASGSRSCRCRRSRRSSCEGLARVDFFVLPDERVVINEINTMPGFTPSSMFPRMWAATGLAYPELVDRLIQLALQRDTGLR